MTVLGPPGEAEPRWSRRFFSSIILELQCCGINMKIAIAHVKAKSSIILHTVEPLHVGLKGIERIGQAGRRGGATLLFRLSCCCLSDIWYSTVDLVIPVP